MNLPLPPPVYDPGRNDTLSLSVKFRSPIELGMALRNQTLPHRDQYFRVFDDRDGSGWNLAYEGPSELHPYWLVMLQTALFDHGDIRVFQWNGEDLLGDYDHPMLRDGRAQIATHMLAHYQIMLDEATPSPQNP